MQQNKMTTLCYSYRQIRAELETMEKEWMKDATERIRILNLHTDTSHQILPNQTMAEVHPELDRQAMAIYAECDQHHVKRNNMRSMKTLALKMALEAIGEHFGALMHKDKQGTLNKRFLTYWGMANEQRLVCLDGVVMGGCWDVNGSMFTSFAKAMGYKQSSKFDADLLLERRIANGEVQPDIGISQRLGLALFTMPVTA